MNLSNAGKYGKPEIHKTKRVKQSQIIINSNKSIFDKILKFKIYMQKQSPGLLFCLTGVRELPETPAASKLEFFVILVNGLQPLTNVTKNSILDVARVPDTPLNEALSVWDSCIYC